jgi:hypothetical protein
MASDREFRFGIGLGDGSPGAARWKMKTSATNQDVYVSGTSPRPVYVSLHANGTWFVRHRVKGVADKRIVRYLRPKPVVPGLTRAVSIMAHGSWGSSPSRAEDADDAIAWVIPPPGDVLVCFDVFLEDRGEAEKGWPGGESMGTQMIGRLPLPRGGTVCVVAWCVERGEQTFEVPHSLAPAEAQKQVEVWQDFVRSAADPRMVVVGETVDGAIALRYGRCEVS